MSYHDFYGGPFSNFLPSRIYFDHPWEPGRKISYRTVEHYFQAAKATNKSDHDWVAFVESPTISKMRGRKIQLRTDWEDVKYEVMLEGLRRKFQIPHLRDQLLETGDKIIREDSPTDFEWGYRNNGQNLLGKALMQVREEIIDGHH